MTPEAMRIEVRPKLNHPQMVLGLSGWMDGGDVSTGVIRQLVRMLGARKLGEIEPEGFYLCSFPGTMGVAAMFRPHTEIKDGLIVRYEPPANTFYYSRQNNLILFVGKEPNLRWDDYVDCILSLASTFGVDMSYFIGSVAGLVPHTREPRLFSTVSDEALKPPLEQCGIRFSDYDGPASVVTLLTREAGRRGHSMATLVAEIPAYIQGHNPRCIESVIRRLAAMLGLEVRLDKVRRASDVFEKKLNNVLEGRTELAELISKLEEDYDNEVFDTQMGDLKQWLEDQGIRLD